MSLLRKALSLAVKEGEELVAKKGAKSAAKITAREGTPKAVARDVLREAAKPSKGRPTFAVWRGANPDNGSICYHQPGRTAGVT